MTPPFPILAPTFLGTTDFDYGTRMVIRYMGSKRRMKMRKWVVDHPEAL